MRGIDVFCERCGARQPTESREATPSGGKFARRLRSAVTGTTADGVPQPTNTLYLRLCLECRGYSCPNCWNQEAAVCQTCAPLPEPEVLELPQIDAWITPSVATESTWVQPTIEFADTDAEPIAQFDAVGEVAEVEPEPELVEAVAEVAEPEPEPVEAVAEP